VPKKVVKSQAAPGTSACGDGLLRPFPDAAAFLGIGRSKMFALMADGTIPTVRIFDGGPRRVPKADLVRYLDARVNRRAL
jgi:excisionase family DNA binding protein